MTLAVQIFVAGTFGASALFALGVSLVALGRALRQVRSTDDGAAGIDAFVAFIFMVIAGLLAASGAVLVRAVA